MKTEHETSLIFLDYKLNICLFDLLLQKVSTETPDDAASASELLLARSKTDYMHFLIKKKEVMVGSSFASPAEFAATLISSLVFNYAD